MGENKKKRKLNDNTPEHSTGQQEDIDTSKPTAVFAPKSGRSWTLSLALPGSIVSNAKNHDSKTHLAGSIARALAVFCVDEIVIFDDGEEGSEAKFPPNDDHTYTAFSHPSHFLSHLLSFLETPPQLRKTLFPMHPNLRTAGTLPSLDMPHHLRANEWCEYREGVTAESTQDGTYADVGLSDPKLIQGVQISKGTRVTLRLSSGSSAAEAVDPAEPREQVGYYWGYTLRQSPSLSAVLTECPYDGGYDVSIGTSERGRPLGQIFSEPDAVPRFNHLLLVFGGVAGLETAAANDAELVKMGIGKKNVGELFDYWVNVLPGQGSRTIRTEEAVWLGLMGTRVLVDARSQIT